MLGVLMSLPTYALEFNYEYKGQTLTYSTINDAEAEVRGNNTVSGDLEIPSKVTDGEHVYTVTALGEDAFYNCKDLTKVIIPEGVTKIGNAAFWRCSELASITIPEGVTSIGSEAFSTCRSLTSINIPESVTEIGSAAFWECTDLTSIIIPEGVTEIGSETFYGCRWLDSVIIRKGVTKIGSDAFSHCYSLTSINIPESVTSIGNLAFSQSGLTSVIIPEGVIEIGRGAFSHSSYLTSITIPESVTSIGNQAFFGSPLTTVVYKANNQFVEANSNVFDDSTYKSATLYLTEDGLLLYSYKEPWKNFRNVKNISEYDSSSGLEDNMTDFDAEKPYEVYNLSGVKIAENTTEGLASGVYIRRQGAKTEKFVVK